MVRHTRSGRCRSLISAAALALAAITGGARDARAESPGALLCCVQERYGALRDLSASFAQESRVVSLGRPRTRSGTLSFMAPGRMRWEYAGPERELIVADGERLWFYRPERRQVVVQPIDAAFTRQTPLLFLLGRGDFGAEFTWEERDLAPGPGGAVSIALRPRLETPDLARLVLEVIPGECRLVGTLVEDAFGNVTRLAFSGERRNPGLDAGLFRFTPPPDVEVVRP
jgi:outer membrane lipoprotein carrier protein